MVFTPIYIGLLTKKENMFREQVQFYSEKLKKLKYPVKRKVLKLLANNCLECIDGHWICKPILGYNTRTYTIEEKNGGYECNCQGCQSRIRKGLSPICSHILAVRLLRNDLDMEKQGKLFKE